MWRWAALDERSAYQIVEGIYNSVITNDITKRHNIMNFDLFNRVVKYIVENVGKTFSANAIAKFLKSEGAFPIRGGGLQLSELAGKGVCDLSLPAV